jgi:hypothetical protein
MSLEQALKRPRNYNQLSAREQWAIDDRLGILDWDPTDEEVEVYREKMFNEKVKIKGRDE